MTRKNNIKILRITNMGEFKAVGLKKTKSLEWRLLNYVLSGLGSMYLSIELELGPRNGLKNFYTETLRRIDLYSDASAHRMRWGFIGYRIDAQENKTEIIRKVGSIKNPDIQWATPAEAYAVCRTLEWVGQSLNNNIIKKNEPIYLYVDNSAIYWKLIKNLEFGKYLWLYKEMLKLSRPLIERGRLQVFGCSHETNLAHNVI